MVDILRLLQNLSGTVVGAIEEDMLAWRIIISVVLISVLAGLFWFDNQSGTAAPVLLVFTLLLAGRGTWELYSMLSTRSIRMSFALTLTGTMIVVTSGWGAALVPWMLDLEGRPTALESLGIISLALTVVVLGLFVAGAIRYRKPGDSMETLCAELATVCYIGLLLAVTAQLRWVEDATLGYYALGSLIVCAKSGDIGAYFLGKNWGGPKLVPLLSPSKTWAGAVGAILGSILGGTAWLVLALKWFNAETEHGDWIWMIVYSGLVGLSGMVGDLCESLIKRDYGQKDSAPLMPGFGGLLDLLDSVIFAGPVAFLLWLVLPMVHR